MSDLDYMVLEDWILEGHKNSYLLEDADKFIPNL